LDFSNEALQASEKGLEKLMNAIHALKEIKPGSTSSFSVQELSDKCFDALNQDFNTPVMISHLYDGVKHINLMKDGKETLTEDDLNAMRKLYDDLCFEILGLLDESATAATGNSNSNSEVLGNLVDMIQQLRATAKAEKNYALSDKLRDDLKSAGIAIKDTRDGYEWSVVKD
jgi:cysteinyl-tRNA synthetase